MREHAGTDIVRHELVFQPQELHLKFAQEVARPLPHRSRA